MIKKSATILWIILFFFLQETNLLAADKKRMYWESEGIVWNVKTKQKVVSLTFDDGPHPMFTKMILDILNKHHIKATFFIVGKKAQQQPDLIREMDKKGHEIANHTFKHPGMHNISSAQLESEIRQTDQLIFDLTGKHPSLFRPPDGVYNKRILNVVSKNKYRIIMYSVDPKDWSNTTSQKIIKTIVTKVKPGDIILLHDLGGNRSITVNSLEDIINKLNKEGYQFKTVSELIKMQNSQKR